MAGTRRDRDVRHRAELKSKPTSFPTYAVPCIGRESELAVVSRFLDDPACRLLTLVGPGGIGKTRLAVEAALAAAERFPHGAVFVDLQPLEDPGRLSYAIADALNIPLSGADGPAVQLCEYLRDRQLLLTLDNFDGLLGVADFVAMLLREARNLQLMITSREALKLQEERLFPVYGLRCPEDDAEGATEYGAIEFFVHCAERLRPDFPTQVELGGVGRICRLVEGFPLALEMAAAWTRTLRCWDIANEIERDFEFLGSNLRDVPQHHRSMRVVFDQSWRRLDQDERDALKRLSLFLGGVDVRAAREVGGASLGTLSRLVDKSVLRVDDEGRYHIHELIRQYTAEELDRDPKQAQEAQVSFDRYFVDFLHTREGDLMAGRQKEAALEIGAEIENIRGAWRRLIAGAELDAIEKSVMALSLFHQYQSRYVEGNLVLEEAEAVLRAHAPSPRRDMILASVLCDLGWLRMRLGRIEQAEQSLMESMETLERLGSRPALAHGFDPRIPLALIASIRGDYVTMEGLGAEVLTDSRTYGEIWNEQFAYFVLTRKAILNGDFEIALEHARQTCRLAEQNGDSWFMAYCLNELGGASAALGDLETARGYFQASFEIRRDFNDPEGMAVALSHLGDIALKESDLPSARAHLQQSHDIYREINDRGGLAAVLNGLALVALAEASPSEARRLFSEALRIGLQIRHFSMIALTLTGIARLLVRLGESEEASRMLSVVATHPASEQTTVAAARTLGLEHGFDVESSPVPAGRLEELVERWLVWLSAMEIRRSPSQDASPLVDPLTDRELEVLGLVARGLTNRQIADEVVISLGTAKWYTSQIYLKLGVQNRTQAVAKARQLGLIP